MPSPFSPRVAAIPIALALLGCAEATPPPPPTPELPPARATASVAMPSGASAPPVSAKPPVAIPEPVPPSPPIALATGGKRAVHGKAGLVTSVEAHASRAGADVLGRGGNAVDAAVAVAYVLAVTHPSAGNIGGGGFMLVRMASGEAHAIDFRETAPKAATTEKMMAMIDSGAIGYASTAVPGTVAGLELARAKLGTLPLADLMAPAIQLAKKGHPLGKRQALALAWQWEKLKRDAAARSIFGRGHKGAGGPLGEGQRLVQKDLAATLERIAREGPADFYRGETAKRIARAMKDHGGDVTLDDLAAYEPKLREPLRFTYRGFTIETMPPPSMGGIAIAQTLMTLERLRSFEAPVGSAQALHLFVEAAKRSYAERRAVGADPDFYPKDMPPDALSRMLSTTHLMGERAPIDPTRATPPEKIAALPAELPESPETTHFSIVDRQGNAVSCTVTQSAGYGSKVVIPDTGVLLSNALGAFSETGVNAVEPGKRMASSMAPTLASRGGRVELVLGSPGGDTIPNVVAKVTENLIDGGMTVDRAVLAPRLHHQWLPDRIRTETSFPLPSAVVADLQRMGHEVVASPTPLGDANIIVVDPDTHAAWGFADPREGGLAAPAP
jgi:gamma-glutamyltranspeptidase / glutathione hydrolase